MEEWKPIPGFAFYEASNQGRVRSIPRTVPSMHGTRRWKGKVLRGIENKGYLVVKLGHPNMARGIHQAVALAWLGEPESGMVVNHINGIKTDNRPENLEYVTSSENVHHAYRTGLLSNAGECNANAGLTDAKVRYILARPNTEPATVVADLVDCSVNQVRNVRRGVSWRHITQAVGCLLLLLVAGCSQSGEAAGIPFPITLHESRPAISPEPVKVTPEAEVGRDSFRYEVTIYCFDGCGPCESVKRRDGDGDEEIHLTYKTEKPPKGIPEFYPVYVWTDAKGHLRYRNGAHELPKLLDIIERNDPPRRGVN